MIFRHPIMKPAFNLAFQKGESQMGKIRVGVAGYGTIGQRLADGVAKQGDMELVGVADMAPTLAIRALYEKGMPYDLYLVDGADKAAFDALGIPVKGSFKDLLDNVDIMLDSAPAGIGAKNKVLYEAAGVKAIFQGGEKNDVADVFFHGYANYEKGLGKDYLKLTSCNTTGLIRSVDCLDKKYGIEKVAITIIRRVADPGDYHRGLTNALKMDKAPSHQAVDLMTIMPHVEATGILVHTPVTHGHIITVVATGKQKITKEMALEAFQAHPRIRVVRIDDGFQGNASLFKYARDLGNSRGDMYEIGLWEDSIVESGNDIMFAINIPQESVTIPETMDGIRAAMKMQETGAEATAKTNEYLGIGKFKALGL
jgi:glyceraldehyde-3-phosphate dehydrogenase (NAD(P))